MIIDVSTVPEGTLTAVVDMSFARADLILRAFKSYECFYIDEKTGEKLELIDAVALKSKAGTRDSGTMLELQDGYVTCERMRRVQ